MHPTSKRTVTLLTTANSIRTIEIRMPVCMLIQATKINTLVRHFSKTSETTQMHLRLRTLLTCQAQLVPLSFRITLMAPIDHQARSRATSLWISKSCFLEMDLLQILDHSTYLVGSPPSAVLEKTDLLWAMQLIPIKESLETTTKIESALSSISCSHQPKKTWKTGQNAVSSESLMVMVVIHVLIS